MREIEIQWMEPIADQNLRKEEGPINPRLFYRGSKKRVAAQYRVDHHTRQGRATDTGQMRKESCRLTLSFRLVPQWVKPASPRPPLSKDFPLITERSSSHIHHLGIKRDVQASGQAGGKPSSMPPPAARQPLM